MFIAVGDLAITVCGCFMNAMNSSSGGRKGQVLHRTTVQLDDRSGDVIPGLQGTFCSQEEWCWQWPMGQKIDRITIMVPLGK